MELTESRAEQILRRHIAGLEGRMQRLAQQVEAIAAHAAPRQPPSAIYLGGQVALTRLQSGHMLYVDTRSVDIGSHLLMHGDWEPGCAAAFQRLVRPGDTVLDVGANHGFHSVLAAARTGSAGQVHAFEPNPGLSRLAASSLAVNGFADRTLVHNFALGDRSGEAQLVFDPGWSGAGALEVAETSVAAPAVAVPCRVLRLDEVFPQPQFRADVLKLSVEGAEAAVLRGMPALLERSPMLRLMLKLHPQLLPRHGDDATKLLAPLQALGFRFWTVQPDSALRPVRGEELTDLTSGSQAVVASRQDIA